MKKQGISVKGTFKLKSNPDGRIVIEKASGYGLTLTQRMAQRKRAKKPKYGKATQ